MRRAMGRFLRISQISLISDSIVSTTRTPVIATKMIDGPTTFAAPSASTTTYSWTIADADTGSKWRSRNVSSTLRKSWKIGKFATNANATVASGTNPSSVTNDKLPAARNQPMLFRRAAARRKKLTGPKGYDDCVTVTAGSTLYDYRRRKVRALPATNAARKENPMNASAPPSTPTEVAVFGGGCFWCLDAVFRELNGVTAVESGYAGGNSASPSYEDVCTGRTAHAEVVRVTFDPSVLSVRDLLTVFFTIHDPTT